MKCPNCQTDVKESLHNPGVYVCRCLGYVEDLTEIAKKVGNTQNLLSGGVLTVIELTNPVMVMDVGRDLENAASTRPSAERYLRDGKVFGVYRNKTVLYMIWILRKDNLIPGGVYFGKKKNEEPNEEDRVNFREVTTKLINKGDLGRQIFNSFDHRTRFFLAP